MSAAYRVSRPEALGQEVGEDVALVDLDDDGPAAYNRAAPGRELPADPAS